LKEAVDTSANEKEKSKYAEFVSILSNKELLSPLSLEKHLEQEHANHEMTHVKAKRPNVKQFRQSSSIPNRRRDDKLVFKEAGIIELVKEKTKVKWPINSQIDIFLRLSELDPFYSLEFLAENDLIFQKKHPSVHKNVMTIGLCLIDQIDVALYQVESILDLEIGEGLEGLIFPKTVRVNIELKFGCGFLF